MLDARALQTKMTQSGDALTNDNSLSWAALEFEKVKEMSREKAQGSRNANLNLRTEAIVLVIFHRHPGCT